MYKILLYFIVFVSICNCAIAQGRAPGMKWQKKLGGSNVEWSIGKSSLVDRDGLYLIGGSNSSKDGDVTGNHTGTNGQASKDIWVVKLDTQRNIIWSASLGGSSVEEFGSLQLAHDSGYIVTGVSNSNDGNVTGNHGGGGDAWVVRLGNRGNVIWQKCLGGSAYDLGKYISPIADGYIFLGESLSTNGDLTGGHGNYDIWVVKLDKSGNIIWQKSLGGSKEEHASVIKQTTDGGYIITGTTSSNDGDVQGLHETDSLHGSDRDIWVVKLDRNGSIEWQKCLGGSNEDHASDIELTATGGYIVIGSTKSDDGDITGFHSGDTIPPIATDAWVVSLSLTGALEWQKCLGGKKSDELFDLQILPDQTFIAVGETYSNDGDVSFLNGVLPDCWLVNFNNINGNIIWEKTFGTTVEEHGITLSLTNSGNIVIGGYRTATPWLDMWLFEVGSINTIAGRVFYDANSDGIQNNGESSFDKVTIRSGKNGDTTSAIPRNGYYTMDVDTGTFSTKAIPYNNYYTIVPGTKSSTFNGYFNTDSVHFAVQPIPGIRDVNISLVPVTPSRPGFNVQYNLLYKNVGTNTVSTGYIQLIKDRRLNLTGAVPSATTVSGDTIKWDYSNLAPNSEAAITLIFSVGTVPTANLGDTLKSVAWINQDGVDVTPIDDTITLKQIVRGSFDPNDKTEANAGIITPAQVSGGEYLNYTIRFQNTGTDTAYNITVRDTLENRLDWNTIQMISASHAYQLSIEDGNKLTWQFNNIKLPYTEPDSHGYIAYRIKPKPTVPAGDTIKNTAGIYFDYNLPVTTNTEKTIVFMVSAPLPVNLLSFQAALDGSVVNVTWKTSMEENLKQFEVQRSANGVDYSTIGIVKPGQTTYLFKDKLPLQGYNYYRLKSIDIDGANKFSTIVLVNVKNEADIISSLYPNPGNGNITLKLQGSVAGNVLVQVLDQQGRQLLTKQFGVQNTDAFKTPLQLSGLSKGSYLLRIMINDKVYLHKLLIQ
jgi:fimbrial isopeptide formation D2 family protein